MGLPSRIAAVVTNLRCNQSCTYCASRSPVDDRAFIAPASVRARIDAGIAAGATEILFTGGEPDMVEPEPAATVTRFARADPPNIVADLDYESLTLAQLRARLTSLRVADLEALLAYEGATKSRAPFQTLLANRITRATAK